MTLFELVKIVLDRLYEEAVREHGKETDGFIKERMKYLSSTYATLSDPKRKPVNYKDPATRFAYVYTYVCAHGDFVVQVLEKLRDKLGGKIFTQKNVRASCIGGGPGSDIIGMLKYLSENKKEPVEKLACYLLDREQAWSDTWAEIDDAMKVEIRLNTYFQQLDVVEPDSWKSQQRFLDADIFIMSYFVSEVRSLDAKGQVSKFWTTIFKRAKPGALFIYTDNGSDEFNDYFDELCKNAGLENLVKQSNRKTFPRFTEQKSELHEYTTKFERSPRVSALLSYRALRKPK
ncbi:hypothetical protein sos41_17530 [Alphaproteobacteria bacterium SO-S41]|nr:hypothetical protein sos41_17530 [Alphaproteobacteria bacterium SO-S41]